MLWPLSTKPQVKGEFFLRAISSFPSKKKVLTAATLRAQRTCQKMGRRVQKVVEIVVEEGKVVYILC